METAPCGSRNPVAAVAAAPSSPVGCPPHQIIPLHKEVISMPSNRIGRINEEIQRELADQLRRLKDPRVSQVGMVSITRVDTTSDLRYARV